MYIRTRIDRKFVVVVFFGTCVVINICSSQVVQLVVFVCLPVIAVYFGGPPVRFREVFHTVIVVAAVTVHRAGLRFRTVTGPELAANIYAVGRSRTLVPVSHRLLAVPDQRDRFTDPRDRSLEPRGPIECLWYTARTCLDFIASAKMKTLFGRRLNKKEQYFYVFS